MDINKIVDDVLDKEMRERKIGHYYVSEIPYCLRLLWYRYKIPKKIDAKTLRVFERGNILHGWLNEVLSKHESVKILGNESRLIIPLAAGIFLRGRLDDFVIIEDSMEKHKFVLEIKTTANINYQNGISPHHLMQITPYLMIEECMGKVVYIDAKYLEIKEFETEFKWEIWEKVKNRTLELHEFLNKDKLPNPEAKENGRNWECYNCSYINECLKNSTTPLVSQELLQPSV